MRIRPFRALRPTPAAAAAVACVPYDVVTTDAARALAAGAPLSFLHVTRAEIDLGPHVDPHDPVVYSAARANLARLRREAPLVVEDEPALYVYRLRDGGHEQTGLAGCFPLDDYDAGAIRRHERTRRDKEDDRTHHMAAVGAQTGIVFLAYRRRAEIDDLVAAVRAGAPLFDFEAPDGVRHTVWRATAGQTADLVDGFAAVPALYIADGHHRAASAARARRELAWRGAEGVGPTARDHLLAVAFPDRETRILPYNRTVSDLAGAGPEEFLASVAARLPVTSADAATPGKGAVAMYVDGRWHRVELSPSAAGSASAFVAGGGASGPGAGGGASGPGTGGGASDPGTGGGASDPGAGGGASGPGAGGGASDPGTGGGASHPGAGGGGASDPGAGGSAPDPAAALDAARLQTLLLEPVLRVEDIRTDPRVRFVGGVHGTAELERLVDSGEAAVAFSLAAVTMDELLAVSDAGGIMPPKSTWFEPKLRDGLLTHLI